MESQSHRPPLNLVSGPGRGPCQGRKGQQARGTQNRTPAAASPECAPHCMFSDCGLTVQRVETHGHCLKWKSTEQKWSRKQSKRNQEVIVLLCKTRFLYWYVYWVRPGYKICLFCRLWEENSSTHTPGSRFLPAGCV